MGRAINMSSFGGIWEGCLRKSEATTLYYILVESPEHKKQPRKNVYSYYSWEVQATIHLHPTKANSHGA